MHKVTWVTLSFLGLKILAKVLIIMSKTDNLDYLKFYIIGFQSLKFILSEKNNKYSEAAYCSNY